MTLVDVAEMFPFRVIADQFYMFKGTQKLFVQFSVIAFITIIQLAYSSEYDTVCLKGCTCGIIQSELTQDPLKTLNCSFAKFKYFPRHLPDDVEMLNLRGNSIFTLDDTVADLAQLRELNLSGNRIKSIRGQIFEKMSNLTYLNIGKNDISTIRHSNLKGPTNLSKLILSNNKITYIEDQVFSELLNLESLDMEQNLIGTLYEEWFVGMKNLLSLNLSHNRVHNIPATVFKQLASLEDLNLSGNRISTIDPRAFSGLLHLQKLYLDDNLIARIPTTAFQSMPSLESLTLNNNPVIKVRPLDFSHMNVKEIRLTEMPELSIIDAKGFYNLPNITSLYISNNHKLTYIDSQAFMAVENLKNLDLHNNNLQGIQSNILDLIPNDTRITLYENPLSCDCNLRWLKILLSEGSNSSLVIEKPDQLTCKYPLKSQNKRLRDLDLSKFSKLCLPTILNVTHSSDIYGKVGEQKVLECRALGEPKPKIHWLLPDNQIINTTLNEIRRRFFCPGTLVYNHLNPSDAGPYTCIAENKVGKVGDVLNLTVTGIDIHIFPISSSSNFVTLVWNGTERRSFPEYKIKYSEYNRDNDSTVGQTLTSIASSSRKSFMVSHLNPDTEYQFCIGYEDRKRYWLKISCCFARTQNAHFMLQGITHSRKTTAVAAVGFLFVLAVMFCFGSFASRKCRQKLYENADKSHATFTNTSSEELGSHIPLDNPHKPLLTKS